MDIILLNSLFIIAFIYAIVMSIFLSRKVLEMFIGWKRRILIILITLFLSWVGVAYSSYIKKDWGYFSFSIIIGITAITLTLLK